MRDLETRTILKTDIRGFTARSSSIPSEQLDRLLEQQRALARRIAASFHGRIFKEVGDSFLMEFRSATSAVQAAIAMQRDLLAEQAGLGDEMRIEIRETVATGDVLMQGDDLFGDPVNLAARMEAITPGGEIYVAETACRCLARAEIALEFVDEQRFKGIPEPVRIYRAAYRHATRLVQGGAIVYTDILRFSQLAAQSSFARVEAIIDSWDCIQREAISGGGGAVRLVMGDSYLLTFPNANAAIRAVLEMRRLVEEYNARPAADRPLAFVAGLEVGDLNIYRTAIFGPSANRADFAREVAGQQGLDFALVLTGRARDGLEESLKTRCFPVEDRAQDLRRRMRNRDIDNLWMVR
jgi:class 3 adenylate cyclase